MGLTRKKYMLDKKFQLEISVRAIVLPLLTIVVIAGVLLYFARVNNRLIQENNGYIGEIVGTQDQMIEMFLSTPALQNVENPIVRNGAETFKKNIGQLKMISDNSARIVKNSSQFFVIIIVLTILQTIVIFLVFIMISHKISGPLHVMTMHLRAIQEGKTPHFRPLRKNDKLHDFYHELRKAVEHLSAGRDHHHGDDHHHEKDHHHEHQHDHKRK